MDDHRQQPAEHEHFELHLPVISDDDNITTLLADACHLSRQQVKSCLHNGAVWLESDKGVRRVRRAKRMPRTGDTLHLYYDRAIQQQGCADAELVADHGDYSVWNKPAGMYSQGSRWGDHCTIYRYAETRLDPQRPAFLVHRLDRAASGLIVLAHSKHMANRLSRMFEKRQIEKRYLAKVRGQLDPSSLPRTIDEPLDGKPAHTEILGGEPAGDDSTNLLIRIITGRKHQIRRHLANIDHPIVGDRLYGIDNGAQGADLQLQCCLLRFDCPLQLVTREYYLAASAMPAIPYQGI